MLDLAVLLFYPRDVLARRGREDGIGVRFRQFLVESRRDSFVSYRVGRHLVETVVYLEVLGNIVCRDVVYHAAGLVDSSDAFSWSSVDRRVEILLLGERV